MDISPTVGRSFTVHDLEGSDLTWDKLRTLVKKGRALRLASGAYTLLSDWEHMAMSTRYRHAVWRRWQRTSYTKAVVSHVSAAALWNLPLPYPLPTRLHLSGYAPNCAESTVDVIRHGIAIPPEQVVERYGMPCTTLDRTVVDVAMSESRETAIMCADAAMRLALCLEFGTENLDYGADYEREVSMIRHHWRQLMRERRGRRGIRQAREILELANWKSESPGESVTRLRMLNAGMTPPELQVPVPSPHGTEYRVDMLLKEERTFVEFDGLSKYEDDPQAARRQLLDEKQREDHIRGLTGWRGIRLVWKDISTEHSFQSIMRRYGFII